MKKIVIEGGKALHGTTTVHGSKNSALPILFGTLLLDSPITLSNVPSLHDCKTTFELLRGLGCDVVHIPEKHMVHITPKILEYNAPYDLVKTMRASILSLGPLLAKVGKAKVALPGGCAIGARPVALHLDALQKMGVEYTIEEGYIVAECKELQGADIEFAFPTVGGTENVLMAAVFAKGETILRNVAKEPEIVDLAEFLIKAGAKIEGHGTDTIRVQGVSSLNTDSYRVMADRIEAGTLLVAGIITGGKITLEECPVYALGSVIKVLEQMGGIFTQHNATTLTVEGTGSILPADVETLPYPEFPTDMQAQVMALMCVANGVSTIRETIFENRFMHVQELARMGASIEVMEHTATVHGVHTLKAAPVMASDLRASASLVLAGLVAEGITEVERIYHLDRGYERLEERLQSLGANIQRVSV